ncbi:transcription factor Adf-1-like [Homalodisca vitripennis]|uniref:transcription factor Adf-1-like n=1 Tax=Homalodisca vitripennis TaxID=197043 RepID=UPI001EEC51A4|nr:transcription factor Adf-1-like [Homalodisca vitripennis]
MRNASQVSKMERSEVKKQSVPSQPRFTPDDDETLINEVSVRGVLWKSSHSDFKNSAKKDKIWNDIGELLDKTGEQCKTRWKSIRDNFKRTRRDESSGTGKPAKIKRANYWELLTFLDEADDKRRGCSKAGEGELNYTEVTHVMIDDADGDVLDEDYSILATEQGGQDDHLPTLTTPPQTAHQHTTVSNNDSRQASDRLTVAESPVHPNPLTLARKQKRKRYRSNCAVIDLLKQAGDERNVSLKFLERLVQPNSDKDDIELFFQTMAATVKKFKPSDRAEAKVKVFNVVSDIEMRQFFDPPDTATAEEYSRPQSSSTSALRGNVE